MTGFARTEGQRGQPRVGLGAARRERPWARPRLRLPPGYEQLEPRVREAAGRSLVRGNVSINLNIKRTEGVDADPPQRGWPQPGARGHSKPVRARVGGEAPRADQIPRDARRSRSGGRRG